MNQGQYFRETKLQIAPELCDEILRIARLEPGRLTLRNPPWRSVSGSTSYQEMECLIGVKKAREIKRRKIQMARCYQGGIPITFRQYSLPESMSEALLDACPEWMQSLGRGELIPIVQISSGGNMLYPHRGHHRSASIFCLLDGGGEETRWYDEREPFELISEYRIPDVSKLEMAASTVLKKNVWTAFNHAAWHSVHSTGNFASRINVGIDFATMTMDRLSQLISENEA